MIILIWMTLHYIFLLMIKLRGSFWHLIFMRQSLPLFLFIYLSLGASVGYTCRSKESISCLSELMEDENVILRIRIEGVDLLIFTSKQLHVDSQSELSGFLSDSQLLFTFYMAWVSFHPYNRNLWSRKYGTLVKLVWLEPHLVSCKVTQLDI